MFKNRNTCNVWKCGPSLTKVTTNNFNKKTACFFSLENRLTRRVDLILDWWSNLLSKIRKSSAARSCALASCAQLGTAFQSVSTCFSNFLGIQSWIPIRIDFVFPVSGEQNVQAAVWKENGCKQHYWSRHFVWTVIFTCCIALFSSSIQCSFVLVF